MFEVAHELNPKNTKCKVVSRSRTYALCYSDLTLSGVEIEELRSLRILWVTLDTMLPFETHLREVVSKVVRSLAVVRRVEHLFDHPRVLMSFFNACFVQPRVLYPCVEVVCGVRNLL